MAVWRFEPCLEMLLIESVLSFRFGAVILMLLIESVLSFRFGAVILVLLIESVLSFRFGAVILVLLIESVRSFRFEAVMISPCHFDLRTALKDLKSIYLKTLPKNTNFYYFISIFCHFCYNKFISCYTVTQVKGEQTFLKALSYFRGEKYESR
ncbi:hypothetical protein SAMN02745189_00061 [Lacicoccus alkaliphilus DSM 16010]|uniref:Uncharacterized protein n=1 Tax=Lacicoccus alkaliphilus DSM 16010 TaxID=1123231 RepID=A0A1M7A8V5_9BACL|nr:hypothetical protein SAMN02745189_00061 [Salinicoccus alkaliphilus DSM 16010]